MYLNNHSYYSLRYGTLPVEKLVKKAKELKLDYLALTDINNVSGIPDFVRECNANGIKPVAGMEFKNGDRFLFTAIASNNEGFREMNEFLSDIIISGDKIPQKPPLLQNVNIIFPFDANYNHKLKDNEWIGVKPSQVSKLFRTNKSQLSKMVIMQPVVYDNQKEYYLHKNLRAIDHNTLISRLSPGMYAEKDEFFIAPDKLNKVFGSYQQIIKNSNKILEESSINFDLGKDKNKATFTGSRYEDKVLLEKLAFEGLEYRYGKNDERAAQRLKRELEIINKLGFSAYFLITHDIIRYSLNKGYFHIGRGSGANSIVAYCLKITDVDPIDLDLYFERFLNPKRTSPPDFDIDYSWKEREKIQKYIFERFGRKHVALLGTSVTFKGKSVYRELGKVYGLPKAEIDKLSENPAKEISRNNITKHIHSLALMMTGFPNQRSIHAGGVLISEKPITYYTALDMPPKGFPTTQWDMYTAEELGFEKLDILSQRGIGHIKDAVEIIAKNKGVKIDIHKIDAFKKDIKVKEQLKNADTNGCFYIESPAMRGLLKKLQCSDYLTLVAASSIIRPGVAKSGMMREYIYRFHNPDNFNYIHPVMKEQLEETYGVMVYQEDVLKVCHHFAGLDLADADVLRRAMSGKHRSKKEFKKIVDKFFFNCKLKGYDENIVKEVWRQIESFAGYSFSKAHSASYAVESFQSLFLKAHFPLEFQVAVINNFGGFYHTWVYFNELTKKGAKLYLPCINNSKYLTSIKGDEVYMGFVHIQKLEKKLAEKIVTERKNNGYYANLEDFIKRVKPEKEQLIILIRCGALRFSGETKAHLLWKAHLLLGTKTTKNNKDSTFELFRTITKRYELPTLTYTKLEDAYDEIELIGFPVSVNAFDMLQTTFRGEVEALNLEKHIGKTVKMTGRLVTIKYVKTVKKEMMNFGTFVDYKGYFFDTIHFPSSLKKYPFQGYGIYLILGKVVEESGYASIEVQKMARLPLKPDPRSE
jgi:DNA-directed DNA polymerase III PolC